MDKEKALKAHAFGEFAESMAAEEYVKRGYAILERRWHLGKTEIDLIAQINNTVAFIEVKARSGEGITPMEAVTHDKKRRMMKAADAYIRYLKGDYDYRFDFVAVTGDIENYTLEILEDAFLAADFF